MNTDATPSSSSSNDDLVTVATAPTEFQANLIATSLRDAGIQAFVFGAVHGSLPLQATFLSVPVQVRRGDLEKAEQILQRDAEVFPPPSESESSEWEEIDFSEGDESTGDARADDERMMIPSSDHARMPLPAKVGLAAAALILLLVLVGGVLVMLRIL